MLYYLRLLRSGVVSFCKILNLINADEVKMSHQNTVLPRNNKLTQTLYCRQTLLNYIIVSGVLGCALGKLNGCKDGFSCLVWPCREKKLSSKCFFRPWKLVSFLLKMLLKPLQFTQLRLIPRCKECQLSILLVSWILEQVKKCTW